MTDKTYNGWTNYATWRVNLEMFDGMSPRDFVPECQGDLSCYDMGAILKDWALDMIEQSAPEGLARDYAFAFLDDVNWHEIARHKISEYA